MSKNRYFKEGNYIKGLTNKGDLFYIDEEDFQKVSKYLWCKNNSGYINSYIDGKTIFLHRFLLKPESNLEVDHINRKKVDCRKNNLRVCTNSQNQANKVLMSNNSSGYKGVTWHSKNKRWVSRISFENKRINLGSFVDIKEAINVYVEASRELYGEFSKEVRV
jgi:uncharacterized protein YifE (UPF0438 family)